MRYIRLYTAGDSLEAHFIQDELAQEGIECIITNENFTTLMPQLNGMLGAGIQVLVDKDDYERARQIVDGRINPQVKTCPNCNSTNISYGLGIGKRRVNGIIALVIAVLVASPVRHIKQTYYCRDCKTEFGV